jgi:hypothetical protein
MKTLITLLLCSAAFAQGAAAEGPVKEVVSQVAIAHYIPGCTERCTQADKSRQWLDQGSATTTAPTHSGTPGANDTGKGPTKRAQELVPDCCTDFVR